jgi:hypothetical protein
MQLFSHWRCRNNFNDYSDNIEDNYQQCYYNRRELPFLSRHLSEFEPH